ncbi:MAG: LysM peptidoglycan-binding domain-containing protein [Armatimonadetes bacterium]|nr:LysM peptidoglycan-binding domain-containing protein [Armatimonadota bacterium]
MRTTVLRLLEARDTTSGERVWEASERRPRYPRWGFLLAAAAAGALLAAGLFAGRPAYHDPEPRFREVTVSRGDSLWSLARRHAHAGQYLPDAVDGIRRANHLRTSRVTPGQKLRIPVDAPARITWQPGAALARDR